MDPSHVIEFPEIKDKNLLDVMKVCWLICYDMKNQTCICQYLQPQNNSLVYGCQKKDHFLAFPNELKLERVTREAGA